MLKLQTNGDIIMSSGDDISFTFYLTSGEVTAPVRHVFKSNQGECLYFLMLNPNYLVGPPLLVKTIKDNGDIITEKNGVYSATTTITEGMILVDAVTYARTVGENRTFTYNGTNWVYNQATVDLNSIGITIVKGTPVSGNTITVTPISSNHANIDEDGNMIISLEGSDTSDMMESPYKYQIKAKTNVFEPLASKPSDWGPVKVKYYKLSGGSYVHVEATDVWATNTYYKKEQDGTYTILAEKPTDWDIDYCTKYYYWNPSTGLYTNVAAGTEWNTQTTYYNKKVQTNTVTNRHNLWLINDDYDRVWD